MEYKGDKLTDCPCCGSNACYEAEFNVQRDKIKTWMCMTCGFTSNTTMEVGSLILKQAEELTADLIKDLKQVHNNLAWFPTVITMPERGMIFPEPIKGTGDWGWTVVKAIPIPKKDQDKYPDPENPGKFYEHKMDMKNQKKFDKLCFMDAAEELGMFVKKQTEELLKKSSKKQ